MGVRLQRGRDANFKNREIWADGAPKFGAEGAEFFEKTVFIDQKAAVFDQETPI